MGNLARKFMPRAPRYVLRPMDNQLLRFATDRNSGHVNTTEFVNVSQTGAAFIVDRRHSPKIGERIKVEFGVPGSEPIAWFAKVVRIEECSYEQSWARGETEKYSQYLVIGIIFNRLPEGHAETIRQGLNRKFREVADEQRKRQVNAMLVTIRQNMFKFSIFILCGALTLFLMWFFTQPDARYDKDRGSPWGRRF